MAASALLVLVAADAALQRLVPAPPKLMEVEEGVAAYEAGDPDTLVLGSSHTRSFLAVRDRLQAEGGARLAPIPVEWGTFTSYQWVWEHRVRSLVDARDASGAKVRGRLTRAVLVTTFYDLCTLPASVGGPANLPARGWTTSDFVADVATHGLTSYNRNFLQWRLGRALSASTLLSDRGYGKLTDALHDLVRPGPTHAEQREASIAAGRRHMEEQFATCDDAAERRALRSLVDDFVARGVEPTIVLFPLLPGLVSPRSRETTLRRYEQRVAELASEVPARVVDLTFGAPLVDDDFQDDLDHVRRESNPKFAEWALAGGLAYLRTPRAPGPVRGEAASP